MSELKEVDFLFQNIEL